METITYNQTDPERIDTYLSTIQTDFSRSKWQRAIKCGDVLVNDQKVSVSYKLQPTDTIAITAKPIDTTVTLPDIDIEILHQSPDYLILNKPAGIPVHPDSKYVDNTLIQQLCKEFPEIQNIDPESTRPGIVHRLDKDVSGVLVVARTKEMFQHLQQQFHDRTVYKEYRALVHNPMPKDSETIMLNLDRDKKTGKIIARPNNQPGKQAITTYEVLQNFEHFAYLKITIQTGRTHQIRTTMRSLDHPIVGDTLYAKKKTKAHLDVDRMFLHAYQLTFTNLDLIQQSFTCELPQDLAKLLITLS